MGLQPATLLPVFLCEFYEISTLLQISETTGSRYFAKSMFLKISQNSYETPVLEYLFSKVTSLQPITSLKQRLQHGCLPVNFAKFPKTPFL